MKTTCMLGCVLMSTMLGVGCGEATVPLVDSSVDSGPDASTDSGRADSSDSGQLDASDSGQDSQSDARADSLPNDAGASLILTYQYGNQITASTLTIFDLGAWTRIERTSPTTTTTTDGLLSADAWSALQTQVQAIIALENTETLVGAATSLGSSSGTLRVFASGTSVPFIVQDIVRGEEIPSDDQVVRTTDAAARDAILDLVASIVERDMYRLP